MLASIGMCSRCCGHDNGTKDEYLDGIVGRMMLQGGHAGSVAQWLQEVRLVVEVAHVFASDLHDAAAFPPAAVRSPHEWLPALGPMSPQ